MNSLYLYIVSHFLLWTALPAQPPKVYECIYELDVSKYIQLDSSSLNSVFPMVAKVGLKVITDGDNYLLTVGIKSLGLNGAGSGSISSAHDDTIIYKLSKHLVYDFEESTVSNFESGTFDSVLIADPAGKNQFNQRFRSAFCIVNTSYPAYITPMPELSGNKYGIIAMHTINPARDYKLVSVKEVLFDYATLERRINTFKKSDTVIPLSIKKE